MAFSFLDTVVALIRGALGVASPTQMSLRNHQAQGSRPSLAVSPDLLGALLEPVFLQTHVWLANWGSRGFSQEARRQLAWPPEAVAAERPGKWPLLCWEASPFVHLLVHRVSPGAGIGGAHVRKIFRHRVWPSAGWAFLRLSQACFFPPFCMSAVPKAFDDIQHPAPGSEFTLATHSARRALQRLLTQALAGQVRPPPPPQAGMDGVSRAQL